jgi:membrane protease YdiL (CAAX protease family)
VQSQRLWKLESVFLLASGLMISVSLGMTLAIALRAWVTDWPEPKVQFYSSVVSGLSFQGATLVLTHFFLRQNQTSWKDFLGLNDPELKQALMRAVAVTVLVLPMALLLRALTEALLDILRSASELQPALQIIKLSASNGQLVYAGVTAIVIAPLAEEILFRGILYRAMKERGWPRTALVATSLLFGAIHGHLPSFIALSFLGLVFALLYGRTSNLLAPILAHSTFNSVNFFLFIFS